MPGNSWNWTVPLGSLQPATFTLENPDGTPYNITGATWEYVVRLDGMDTSINPIIKITTASTAEGVLNVDVPTATLGLVLNPAATASLRPNSLFAHALWMNPGTATAFCWFSGQFLVSSAAQA